MFGIFKKKQKKESPPAIDHNDQVVGNYPNHSNLIFGGTPGQILSTDEITSLTESFGKPTNDVETWNIDIDGLPPMGHPILLIEPSANSSDNPIVRVGRFAISSDEQRNWNLEFSGLSGFININEGAMAYCLQDILRKRFDCDYEHLDAGEEPPEFHDDFTPYLRIISLADYDPDQYPEFVSVGNYFVGIETFSGLEADSDSELWNDIDHLMLVPFCEYKKEVKAEDDEEEEEDSDW